MTSAEYTAERIRRYKPANVKVTCAISNEEREKLIDLALEFDVTISQVIRTFIRQGLQLAEERE